MFETLTRVPVDPILGVSAAFQKDTSDTKIDLGVGVYKDEAGKTPVPRAVKRAEQELIAAQTSKTYLSPIGNPGFNMQVAELTFGSDFAGRKGDLALAQAPGGSGALRLGAELINAARPGSTVYVSDPTWANHIPLLGSAGLKVEKYPYYDAVNNTVRFEQMLDTLDQLTAGSVIVLHACCHNPTGQDLTPEQWQRIADIVHDRGLLPIVDRRLVARLLGLLPSGRRRVAERVEGRIVAVGIVRVDLLGHAIALGHLVGDLPAHGPDERVTHADMARDLPVGEVRLQAQHGEHGQSLVGVRAPQPVLRVAPRGLVLRVLDRALPDDLDGDRVTAGALVRVEAMEAIDEHQARLADAHHADRRERVERLDVVGDHSLVHLLAHLRACVEHDSV